MSEVVSTMVEVFIFTRASNGPRYLILQRAEDVYMPGIWQGVTGRLEGDENALDAAQRELLEETSITPDELWRVNYVSVFYAPRTHRVQCVPTFAAFCTQQINPKLSTEHQHWEWLEYEQAWQRMIWSTSRKALQVCQEEIAGVEEPNPWLRLIPPPALDMPLHEGPI